MKNFKLYFILLIIPALFTAWESIPTTQEVFDYPEKQIERPASLPADMLKWHCLIPAGLFEYPDDRLNLFPPIPIPLLWEYGISDDLSIVGLIIPLGINYQFIDTEIHGLSTGIGTGLEFKPSGEVLYTPSAQLNYSFSPVPFFTAAASAVIYEPINLVNFGFGLPYYGLNMRASLNLQLTDTVYLEISNQLLNLYDTGFVLFPFNPTAKLSWNINPQYDLEIIAIYDLLVNDAGYYMVMVDIIRYY